MKLNWNQADFPLSRMKVDLPNVFPISILIQGCPAVVLLDTGASCSAVRKTIAQSAGLHSLHEQVSGGGSGLRKIEAEKYMAESVQIGSLTVQEQTWMVLADEAFRFQVEPGKFVEIDGLLGWDVLQHACWQWDETQKQLRVRPSIPEKSEIHEFVGWDNMPVLRVQTNDQIMLWGFDSGNTDTSGGSLLYQSLPDTMPMDLETMMGVDGVTEVPAKRLDSLRLTVGAAEIILYHVSVLNRVLYPVTKQEVAGLCGADLLARRSWRLDYPNRRLILGEYM